MTGRMQLAIGAGTVLASLCVALWWLNVRGDEAATGPAVPATDAATIARGAYLARAGNCQDCHTPRGGAAYAGGRGIPTPFGTVYSSNLTPDVATGIGAWSVADFRRALHNGRSRDGRLMAPAFPYDAYTRISADDADALFAFLRSLPPVAQPRRPHALRFPYNTQAALAVWRALYFRPGRFVPDAQQSAAWNRGAYLVQALGHCGACHAQRNALGATQDAGRLDGGLIPLQNWYAPALGANARPLTGAVELLKTGVSAGAATLGPMAEVVLHSTQHLRDDDLRAMVSYLKSLPPSRPPPSEPSPVPQAQHALGTQLYEAHCKDCHGENGQGVAHAYVPLAGNPAVLLGPPANLVQVVLGGAFAPSTDGNPRPFGMPPFATELSDEDVAAVLSFIRNTWGNQAPAVGALEVSRYRSSVRP